MGALTETTKRVFAKRIPEVMNGSTEELQRGGVDISVKSAELSGQVEAAFSAEERQLRARADAETAIRASEEATANAYRRASDMAGLRQCAFV